MRTLIKNGNRKYTGKYFDKNKHIRAMKNVLLPLSVVLLLFACDKKDESNYDLQFEALEDSLPAIQTKQQLVSFFSHHPQIRDNFFSRQAYPSDSTFINELFRRVTHPSFDTLLMEVHRVFGNNDELKDQFSAAFKNLKLYYPDFNPPKIQTVISGLETDVLISDSLVIVGLDYFLGDGAKYRPNMYEYMLKRYHKNFVVPSVVLLYGISERFNKTNVADKTILADMVAYGKAYAFARHILPSTPDSVLTGYTQKEIDGVLYNEQAIWKRMIEDQVLFGTSHMVKQKYIAERPKTLEISAQCPGRIGMWVGWRIADNYLAETGKKLPDLMREADAQKIFKMSRYRGGVE
jgi:hypothetical protein